MKNKPEEIINTLLKGTFDNIKEESLDIDLSACATIPSTSNLAPDFWLSDHGNTFPEISPELKKNKRKSSRPKKTDSNDFSGQQFAENNELNHKYICKACGLHFSNLIEFSTHEGTHKICFKCNECDKSFSSEVNLQKHFKTHKTVSRKDSVMECPDCGKLLKLSSMWMHKKIHTDSKRYCCDICGQKFVQKINLTAHMKVHTGERPFACSQCKKTFPERSHLLRHQRYHSSTRPFKCEKCGKMYKTERCLKVHDLVHLEQRPFVCKVCSKSFISNSKLKQHSNIHTGERPYKCNYCARDFTNFPNWLKHTRRRHKVDHKTGELLETIPKYNTKSKRVQNPAASSKLTESKKNEPEQEENINEYKSLSLTSAEDLIVEQALEMEECGLYATRKNKNLIEEPLTLENSCDLSIVKEEIFSYNSSLFSSPMMNSFYSTNNTTTNLGRELNFEDTTNIKREISDSPYPLFNSQDDEFKPYPRLPPIATMTANNFFLKTSATLPSVDTLFAFNQPKARSDY